MPLTDMIPNMQAAPPSEKPSTNNETPSDPSSTDTPTQDSQLEPSELAYFKKVSDGLTRSAQLATEAVNLERQATALRGAHESWVSYLVERYHLNPETDQIHPETGHILRGG